MQSAVTSGLWAAADHHLWAEVPRVQVPRARTGVLLARIRAVLRRPGGTVTQEQDTLTAGPVKMDVERHCVSVDGREVALTLMEFHLLELLLRNAGRLLTREQLIAQVWGPGAPARRARWTSTSNGSGTRSSQTRLVRGTSHRPGRRLQGAGLT
jgi:hypothetical protein